MAGPRVDCRTQKGGGGDYLESPGSWSVSGPRTNSDTNGTGPGRIPVAANWYSGVKRLDPVTRHASWHPALAQNLCHTRAGPMSPSATIRPSWVLSPNPFSTTLINYAAKAVRPHASLPPVVTSPVNAPSVLLPMRCTLTAPWLLLPMPWILPPRVSTAYPLLW